MKASDKALWGGIALLGGYCFVTMVLPALLAFGGAYLAATGQWITGIALVIVGGAGAYWLYRRRKAATDDCGTGTHDRTDTKEELTTGSGDRR